MKMYLQLLVCTGKEKFDDGCGRAYLFSAFTVFDCDYKCECKRMISTKRPHMISVDIETKSIIK